jgi:hypothetical protein
MLLEHGQGDRGMGDALREAATFYFFNYPEMMASSFYQKIGEKMIRKFPCLALQGISGKKPWVRMRNNTLNLCLYPNVILLSSPTISVVFTDLVFHPLFFFIHRE